MLIGFFVKIFARVILLPLAAVLLTLSLFSYSASQVLTDKENAKQWISDEKVSAPLRAELMKTIRQQKEFSLAEYLIGQEKVDEFMQENFGKEWEGEQIDLVVDNLYKWLESEQDDSRKVFGIAIPDGFSLIPKVYQTFISIYNRLFIATAVLVGIIFLTSRSFRQGFLLLGIIAVISGGLLYFGPDYIGSNPDLMKKIDFWGINFRWFYEIADVYQQIIILALQDVFDNMNIYALYLFAGGVATVVATQFALKRVVVEDELDGYDETDYYPNPKSNGKTYNKDIVWDEDTSSQKRRQSTSKRF